MLIFLTLFGLLLLISSRRRKDLLTRVAILLMVYAATSGLIVALATQVLVFSLPADSGATVDTIVVLGRGKVLRNRRVETAAQLWQAKRAPLIFASGMSDAPQVIELLETRGIPRQLLSGESCSQNTEENVLFTAAVLHPQGLRQILLITDPPHMLRSYLTFRSFGFTVIPHTSPLPPDLTSAQETFVMFREYLGIVSYAFLGRFQQRPESELNHPPAAVLEKLSTWHCLF